MSRQRVIHAATPTRDRTPDWGKDKAKGFEFPDKRTPDTKRFGSSCKYLGVGKSDKIAQT